MDHLNALLALTFPGASVVVQDQVIGYRRKKDLFILLVDVFSGDEDQAGTLVVKIGSKRRRARPSLITRTRAPAT